MREKDSALPSFQSLAVILTIDPSTPTPLSLYPLGRTLATQHNATQRNATAPSPADTDGVRVNPVIDLFTTTGRMITSDPPLQNLDHKIRLTRSWRTSLAEEAEAGVPGLEVEQMFRVLWFVADVRGRPLRFLRLICWYFLLGVFFVPLCVCLCGCCCLLRSVP